VTAAAAATPDRSVVADDDFAALAEYVVNDAARAITGTIMHR